MTTTFRDGEPTRLSERGATSSRENVDGRAPWSQSNKLRVLYVTGSGRSGSTVLDTVLGNHPRISSFGELCNLMSSGWLNNEYCACGTRAQRCPFWEGVRKRWEARVSGVGPSEYFDMQLRFEFARIRSLSRLAAQRIRKTSKFYRYEEATVALFRSIADETGTRILVDSSKNPVRLACLRLMSGLEVRAIHLIRDGRGVLLSLKKRLAKNEKAGVQHDIPPRPTWRVALFWIVTNILSEWVGRGIPVCQVTYEELVTKPGRVLKRLSEVAGLDLSELGKRAGDGEAMQIGHTIAGNRVRMCDNIRLRADFSWRDQLPDADRRWFWALTGWLMRRYGYTRA